MVLVVSICLRFYSPQTNSISIRRTNKLFENTPTIFYDHGNPTAEEQYMLELHNRARKDPNAEALRLELDLQDGIPVNITPQPPLAMQKNLCETADNYSAIMYELGMLGHSVDGSNFQDRASFFNYTGFVFGESVASFFNPVLLFRMLMEDAGWETFGEPYHREFILGVTSNTRGNEIGIGNYQNYYCDILYGRSNTLYLLGVIYNDTNENDFYDIGEGLGGVQIMPDKGDYWTLTSSSGGYAIPITLNGTIALTVSGGDLSTSITKYVDVSTIGENIKIDFRSGEENHSTTSTCLTTTEKYSTTSSLTITSSNDISKPSETIRETTNETTNFISLSLLFFTFFYLIQTRRKQIE